MCSQPILVAVCCLASGVLIVTLLVSTSRADSVLQSAPSSSSASQRTDCTATDKARPVLANRVIRMKVTAYCLCKICCGKWADFSERKTSIGDNARKYDGVAADPNLLPYRTRLEIPGLGVKEVDDTGGGMRQSAKKGIYHIDVRMPSHEAALRWGIRWLDVVVLSR